MRNEQHEDFLNIGNNIPETLEKQHRETALKRLFWTLAIVVITFILVTLISYVSWRKTPQKPFTRKISPAYRMIENLDTTGTTKDILTFYPDSL